MQNDNLIRFDGPNCLYMTSFNLSKHNIKRATNANFTAYIHHVVIMQICRFAELAGIQIWFVIICHIGKNHAMLS